MGFKYFAYGSNIFTPKMRVPAPSAEFRMIGRVAGYVLRFNKHSKHDGSGKGNIVTSGNAGDEVWGVLFEIDEGHRPALDESEGGYIPIELEVLTAHGPVPALTYVAKTGRVDNSLKPYTWYKQLVLHGARQHGVPPAYIQGLETVEVIDDPDEGRRQRNEALLLAGS